MSAEAITIVLALCGFSVTISLFISGAAFGFVLNTVRKVTRLETIVEVMMPQLKLITAASLHSPDDHHRMDDLLVKWAQGIIDRQEELPELVRRAQTVAATAKDEVERLKVEGLLKLIRAEYQIG